MWIYPLISPLHCPMPIINMADDMIVAIGGLAIDVHPNRSVFDWISVASIGSLDEAVDTVSESYYFMNTF